MAAEEILQRDPTAKPWSGPLPTRVRDTLAREAWRRNQTWRRNFAPLAARESVKMRVSSLPRLPWTWRFALAPAIFTANVYGLNMFAFVGYALLALFLPVFGAATLWYLGIRADVLSSPSALAVAALFTAVTLPALLSVAIGAALVTRYGAEVIRRVPFPVVGTLVAAVGSRYWSGYAPDDMVVRIPIPADITTLSVDVLRDPARRQELGQAARNATTVVLARLDRVALH